MSEAITAAEIWSEDNNMTLNSSKTVVLNVSFSHKPEMDLDVPCGNGLFITPLEHTKLLGVEIDSKLNFSEHVNSIVLKCNSRIFLMKQLRSMGMSPKGLETFYVANIKSIISYASPVWLNFISVEDMEKLESIQCTATKFILPNTESYEARLDILAIPKIEEFLMSLCTSYFLKIANDTSHPLFTHIVFNNQRISSRRAAVDKYRPPKCRTAKRQRAFFPFYMQFFTS